MLKQWLVNKLQGPVYLDCYTDLPYVYEHAKIRDAGKFRPKWIDKLPPVIEKPMEGNPNVTFPENTMRLCAGVTDLYKNALCLPLWTDLTLYVGPQGTERYYWKTSDPKGDVVVHPQHQRGSFLPALEYQHTKLTSPWNLHCAEDVNFLMMDPFWNGDPYNERPFAPPGIVNYKYQGGTHINLFTARPSTGDKKIEFKYNDPIALIVPLTERKVIVRHHLVSFEEKIKYTRPPITFNGTYYAGRKAMMDAEKEAKCPMKSK